MFAPAPIKAKIFFVQKYFGVLLSWSNQLKKFFEKYLSVDKTVAIKNYLFRH